MGQGQAQADGAGRRYLSDLVSLEDLPLRVVRELAGRAISMASSYDRLSPWHPGSATAPSMDDALAHRLFVHFIEDVRRLVDDYTRHPYADRHLTGS